MPRFKNEVIGNNLNNIDKLIKGYYKDADQIVFNSDPKIAEVQKAVLYYRLKRTGEHTQKNTLNAELPLILDLSHPMVEFVLEQREEDREPLFEECVTSSKHKTLESIYYAYVEGKSFNAAINGHSRAIDGLFKPKPDRTRSRFEFGANWERSEEMEKAQDEIDAIPLDVPKGLDETAVTYATIGFLFEPETMANMYAKSMKMPGSTAVEGMNAVDGARTVFFESFLVDNERVNMHAPRLYTPAARLKTKNALEEYKKGNKKPIVDALTRAFKESLSYAKFMGAKDKDAKEFLSAAKMVADTARVLDSPEFAREVNLSFDERRWVNSITKYLKNIEELRRFKAEINGYVAKEGFNGVEFKPMDNPEIKSKVEKMLVLQLHLGRDHRAIKSYVEAMSMGANIKDLGPISTNRSMSLEEIYFTQSSDLYNERLLSEIRNSKSYEDLLNMTNLEKFKYEISHLDKNIFGKEYVENIDLYENVGLKNELSSALKNVPSKYGDLKGIVKKLSCMKNNFKKEFTKEDLEKRIEEYQKAVEKIQEKYPEGVMRYDKEMQMDEDCLYEITGPINKEIKRLQDTYDTYDKETQFRKEAEQDYIERSLKETIDPNINVGFQFTFRDKDHNEIDVIDAAEKLQSGEKVILEKYRYGEFIGQGRDIEYSKDNDFKVGIPKVCSRETSLESASHSPTFQLESLKKVKEVLAGTDPFYVGNSTEFNNTMKALDKVIKAQTYIGENPNIRQVETLKELYEDLDKKATLYTTKKSENIKIKDSRGTLRLDTIKSLKSITRPSYVNEMTSSWYAEERHKTNEFREISRPVKMMNKWIKQDLTNIAPEKQEEFIKDFDTIMACAKIIDNDRSQMKYAKMGMAFYFDKMLEARLNPNLPKLSNEDLEYAKDFSARCNKETANYAGMNKEIKAPEKVKDNPVETLTSLHKGKPEAFTFADI